MPEAAATATTATTEATAEARVKASALSDPPAEMLRDRDPARIVQEIMSRFEGVEIRRRHGARFRFRFYLTGTMAGTSIEALELSVRSFNSLRRAGFSTVGELAEAVAGEENVLSRIRNCGRKSADEIMARLFAYQYEQLKPERRDAYLLETVLLNIDRS